MNLMLAIFIGLVVLWLCFFFITYKFREVEKKLARRINIKPHLVDNMIMAMGKAQGTLFIEHMSRSEDDLDIGLYTLVIYQILKNDHIENIKWWKSRLQEHGINPQIDRVSASAAFSYLNSAGADVRQIPIFLETYNSIS